MLLEMQPPHLATKSCGGCAYCQQQSLFPDLDLPVCLHPKLTTDKLIVLVCTDAPACRYFVDRTGPNAAGQAA